MGWDRDRDPPYASAAGSSPGGCHGSSNGYGTSNGCGNHASSGTRSPTRISFGIQGSQVTEVAERVGPAEEGETWSEALLQRKEGPLSDGGCGDGGKESDSS